MILRYSDEVLINGLRQRKQRHINYLYQEFTPVVRHFVKQNSGNQCDVDDLVQDAMIVLYKRILNQPFELKCSLKTFFISICKNLWLQRLDNKYRLLFLADFEVNEPRGGYSFEEAEINEDNNVKRRLMYKNIQSLPADCQHLLELHFLKVPYKEIARLLKFTDDLAVKARKYHCKGLLRKKIMNDPEYYQYFEYERYGNHKRLD
ncbi:MAG: sigma-70 family RNA polymerase sigma factor [Bacteroidota bacterium]